MKVLAFTVIALILSASPEVNLRYKFSVGDEYEYVQVSKQNAIQNLPGMGEMKMEGMLGGTMLMKIKSVDERGSARIETQYSKLKMVTNSFILSVSMDSEGSQDEDGNKIMKAMTGKTFFFNLSKTGSVEKVEGVENLYSGFSSLNLEDEFVTKTKKTLQQTINEKSIKTLLENGLLSYPEKSVKTGDKWNTSTVQAVNFPMNIDNTWSLKDSDGRTATVLSDGKLTTIDKDKVNNLVNGMKSKSDLAGTQTLSGKVDITSGWPKQIKIISDLKGTMTLLAGGLIPQDMAIPMTIKIETDYTIVKKK